MGKARGRPPKPEGTTIPEAMNIRVTAEDKARWTQAAASAGKTLSQWIRGTLDAKARRNTKA